MLRHAPHTKRFSTRGSLWAGFVGLHDLLLFIVLRSVLIWKVLCPKSLAMLYEPQELFRDSK